MIYFYHPKTFLNILECFSHFFFIIIVVEKAFFPWGPWLGRSSKVLKKLPWDRRQRLRQKLQGQGPSVVPLKGHWANILHGIFTFMFMREISL